MAGRHDARRHDAIHGVVRQRNGRTGGHGVFETLNCSGGEEDKVGGEDGDERELFGYTGESEPMFYNYLRPLTSLDEGLYALACEEDVRCLAPWFRATLEDITDEPAEPVCDSVTPSSLPQHDSSIPCKDSVYESITPRCMPDCILTPPIDESFSDINLSFVSQQATASQVIDDVMRQLSFDETELDGQAGFADVAGSGVDIETQSELPVSEEPDVGPAQEPILAEVSTQESIVAKVSTQEPIVAEVGTWEFSVKDVVIEDYVSFGEDGKYAEQEIDIAYETEYDVQSSEDAGTDDDDDVDEDFLVDEENEIVEPDVDVYLFGISMDLPFDNIGITNLVPDDVLEGEDVDAINVDGFDSDPSNDEEINYRKRRVYLHSIEIRRNLKLYKNDSVRIRARCERKVPVFTMSQGTGPTDPNRGMEAGPNGSSGPTTRSKKKKNTGTNDDSQASPSFLDAHDKRGSLPLGLVYFEQVRANPDIPVKAVQDQLQRELEVQISMSKALRAKAKVERVIRGDHVLQYTMLRDYVIELQSTNPNTTVKIAVERNTNPFLPTRVFQRIYVCLGALKLGFRACRRDLLGLDGAFMKGSFLGQVLVAVGLDSNNGIYPLAYALVEAESKSSWCWFLQCLGDDIDLHPNSNFTFISDRQKGIIPAIKTVYPSAEHRYCLRHIHENMKQGWCGQAYNDLLWRAVLGNR
ncbi:heat stress transcription factor B-4-like protein, partial [Tanacetum coccineum]